MFPVSGRETPRNALILHRHRQAALKRSHSGDLADLNKLALPRTVHEAFHP
jgi:hypothetical protein